MISIVDLFSIGIGPSSSHTVGPMRAAYRFVEGLHAKEALPRVAGVNVTLHGSLALTGKGHRTDMAVLLGLAGKRPRTVTPEEIAAIPRDIAERGRLVLADTHEISFDPDRDIVFEPRPIDDHPNGLVLRALDEGGTVIREATYSSIGGGFIREVGESVPDRFADGDNVRPPLPFASAEELVQVAEANGYTIAEVVLRNETAWREDDETQIFLDEVHQAMTACIERGLQAEGVLPGGLNVPRRAKNLLAELKERPEAALRDPLSAMDWVDLYALAVNEENAAGGRVVTAPTNGAAGILPAVIRYYETFSAHASRQGVRDFLLTAGAIGMLFKMRASISGAEVGCQGEVGVACSMAAAGLTAALGGSVRQIENAAEIGMEHNLGLTCDPVGGLVQVPCIERNAMGAVKAINAARLALRGDGKHMVSLDQVIETMRQTGADMRSKYKETSEGGLAVNVVEC